METTGLYEHEPRARRLFAPAGRSFLVALDHGLPAGPLPGLEDPAAFLRAIRGARPTAVLANPGLVRSIVSELQPGCGLIVHLSAGTLLGASPTSKVPSAGVTHAVGLGADGVSVQISFGDPQEDRMLTHAGEVVRDAARLGVSVLAMAYGPASAGVGSMDVDAARHAARAAAELGADAVQTNYVGPASRIREIVRGCPVPVVLAGGPKASGRDAYLQAVRHGLEAGAAGVAVGRNLFQDPEPRAFADAIAAAVFGRAPTLALGGIR